MNKTIISAVVVVVFGAFVWFKVAPRGEDSTPPPLPDTPVIDGVPVSNPAEGAVHVMHSFLPTVPGRGTHIYRGIMQLPTPCHRLAVNSAVAESYPEQIQLYFTIVEHDAVCVQRIDARPFEINVETSEQARLGLVMVNGESINHFSVTEEEVRVARPGEKEFFAGEPFKLGFGETKTGEDFSITFTGVEADSRCPINADCFWAGEAVLAFSASRREQVAYPPFSLVFPGDESRTVPGARSYARVGNYYVYLVGVEPEPTTERAPERDYTAVLIVRMAEAGE